MLRDETAYRQFCPIVHDAKDRRPRRPPELTRAGGRFPATPRDRGEAWMRTIKGSGVTLRPLRDADAPAMLALYRRNADFLRPWDPARPSGFYTLAFQQEVIRTGLADEAADRAYTYGIVVQATDELAGRLRLSNVIRGVFQNAYLGYWLDEEQNGRGLMTEAVGLALTDAFSALRLHRVQAATLTHNHGSMRVLLKNGFRREGLAERYLQIDGRWQDHILFAVTSEEWATRAGQA
jgi:[ribosomal protein S5]-alanine N-acetyltransferase